MLKKVIVNDKMQKGYIYYLSKPIGKCFHPNFKPQLTPKQMLNLGVFSGKYMTDCQNEFPKSWFINAKLSPSQKNSQINYFQVNASLTREEWSIKGWLFADDPRGWFQWYCRYYMGRRLPDEDQRQINRWRAFRRHVGAIKKNCEPFNFSCRRKQRQALLQWAYDSRKL